MFRSVEPKFPGEPKSTWSPQMLALSVASFALNPIERLQTLLQARGTYIDSQSPQTIRQLAKRIFLRQQMSSLWRGAPQNFIRQFAQFNLAYFLSSSIFRYEQSHSLESTYKLYLASCCISQLITYPLEIVKNKDKHVDKPYKGVMNCVKQSYKIQGVRGVFGGFSIASLHAGSILLLVNPLASLINAYSKVPLELTIPLSILLLQLTLYPLDTIKKRLQLSGSLEHNFKHNTLKKASSGTLSALYSGLPLRLLYLPLHLMTFSILFNYFHSSTPPIVIPQQILDQYQSLNS